MHAPRIFEIVNAGRLIIRGDSRSHFTAPTSVLRGTFPIPRGRSAPLLSVNQHPGWLLEPFGAIDAVRHDASAQVVIDELATSIESFKELLDPDLLTGGLFSAAVVVESSGIAGSVVAYQSRGLSVSGALQIIHSADATLGRNVDFSG